MALRAVFLEEQAEDVGGDVFALLRHVGLDADVEVRVVGLALWWARDLVQQVGEPEEIVAVAHGPVEVDAAVFGW